MRQTSPARAKGFKSRIFNLFLPNHIIYLPNHLSPHHSAATTMHRFGNRFHFKSGISPTGIFRNRNHPVPLYVSGTRQKIGIRRSPLTLNLLLPTQLFPSSLFTLYPDCCNNTVLSCTDIGDGKPFSKRKFRSAGKRCGNSRD